MVIVTISNKQVWICMNINQDLQKVKRHFSITNKHIEPILVETIKVLVNTQKFLWIYNMCNYKIKNIYDMTSSQIQR